MNVAYPHETRKSSIVLRKIGALMSGKNRALINCMQ